LSSASSIKVIVSSKAACSQELLRLFEARGLECREFPSVGLNALDGGARWDAEREEFVRQRKCFICGYDCDVDDPCCAAENEDGEAEDGL
jgi:hypothetical protein